VPHVYTVRELSRAVKEVLEGRFPFVWVRGQVTNLSRPGSGHIYFGLRDEDAVLNVVWFRSSQSVPSCLKPERIGLGMEVVCAGRMAVYPPRGGYQLIAELIQEEGVGRLHLEFEALKRKLSALGYFDPARKRPLPARVSRVAVVTAPTGAALRDFLCLSRNRGTAGTIRIYPARVQGEDSPAEIAAAMDRACRDGWAEVVVLIRGGGSLEDLWAFNTEVVARAVHESTLPVVCGVGHEIDISIADLVADVRAATPSHAAQLIWPERSMLLQAVDDLELALDRCASRHLELAAGRLKGLIQALSWLSPVRRLERIAERLCGLEGSLTRGWERCWERASSSLNMSAGQLERAVGPVFFQRHAQLLGMLERDLQRLGPGRIASKEGTLALLETRLAALDPMRPLDRGYALVRLEDGTCLRNPAQVQSGDRLEILVREGRVDAEVVQAEPGDDHK
jgi:exodeoxyribonuclease VII large subunit